MQNIFRCPECGRETTLIKKPQCGVSIFCPKCQAEGKSISMIEQVNSSQYTNLGGGLFQKKES
jgi:transcription elongation factor Elf1